MTSMTDLARQDGDAPSRGVRANPLTPWLFLFAPLGLLLVFTLVPVLSMIWYSFTNWDGLDPDVSFVGVKNYQTLLTRPALFQVFFVSLYYVAASFLQMALALYFATVLSFRTRLRNLFKVWDDQLGKRKYAGGDEISVADLSLYAGYWRTKGAQPAVVEGFPNLTKWAEQMAARPAIQRAVKF